MGKKIRCFFLVLIMLFGLTDYSLGQIWFDQLSFIEQTKVSSKQAITSIIQDEQGMVWIGTFGAGLYRFDGINYEAYKHDWNDSTSLNSNLVYQLFIDDKKRLWAGTDAGLNLYNKDLDRFENISLKANFELATHFSARRIIQDNQGYLYTNTYGPELFKINPNELTVEEIDLDIGVENSYLINAFAKNQKGEIFLGTSIGLMQVKDDRVTREGMPEELNGVYIESMTIDATDNIWLGSFKQGVIKVHKVRGAYQAQQFAISDKKVLSMLSMEDKVLVGTENDGLFVLESNGEVLKHYLHKRLDEKSIGSNSVWELYNDAYDRIWVGYYNAGVDIYDEAYSKFGALESIAFDESSLQDPMVTGIEKDSKGRLWISLGSGVDIYDPKTGEIEHIRGGESGYYSGLEEDLSVEAIFVDSKENVWLGTWTRGIYVLKKGSRKFVNYNSENTPNITINAMLGFAEDAKGRIWMASFLNGLHYYDPQIDEFVHCNDGEFESSGLSTADVAVVMTDSRGNIWAGTSFGLFKVNYNAEGGLSVVHLTGASAKNSVDHPSINRVASIYESRDGSVWLGSRGAGLLSYDYGSSSFSVYSNDSTLSNSTINNIIEDEAGTLWLGTESGVFTLDRTSKKSTRFTVSDGLLSDFFNIGASEKDENGVIYFGSYSGINSINPASVKAYDRAPSPYLTDLKLFNETVVPGVEGSPLKRVISETEEITLKHNQSVFTIEYMGTSHTRPEKNSYAYMLEGFDRDWVYVGNARTTTYTNLQPGDYTFKVKVANNDGVWSNEELQLKIEVLPPWYKTYAAYSVYFLLLLMCVFAISSFSRKRFREKQAMIFEKERIAQEENLHQAQLQFFTNISHEFRTPLTLIMNPIRDIIKNYNGELPAVVKKKNEVIYKNSERLSRLINELMDFRMLKSNKVLLKVKCVDIVEQVEVLIAYFYEEADSRNIKLRLETEVSQLKGWADQAMLEKILFNILSNAFKVTPENGEIMVSLREGERRMINPISQKEDSVKTFELSVRDTGPGIDQKDYKHIFKRFYQVGQLNKKYYGSSGVGLEMVKGFVELHHGEISVESELNVGTTFSIYVPLDKVFFTEDQVLMGDEKHSMMLPERLKLTDAGDDDHESTESSRQQTLLIVEDNPDLQQYLKDELNKKYSILVASNGKEGLELALQRSPDLILTDVVMPEIDGFELCKRIKANIKTSHIPLLMLTAKGLVDDRIKGIDLGADAYLTKPFDMRELESILVQLASTRQFLFTKYFSAISNSDSQVTSLDKQFIQKVLDFIHQHMSDPNISVDILASELHLSRSQFYRKVKSLTGKTAVEFIRTVRLQRAKKMIESGNNKINEVCYEVGFSTPSYFSKCFKTEFGFLPTQLLKAEK